MESQTLNRLILSMHRRMAISLVCIVCLALSVAIITRADDFKDFHPTGYVTDHAGIIQPQTKTQLEALCKELEEKTGAQMAIVTVKSLDGADVQTYANDLYKQFGIGSKKDDRGVLLLVAPNDRKYWTEVGYGLEPVITDARAGDAGRLLVPYFRKGDYNGGITAAAWQLAKPIADDKGVSLTGAPPIQQVRRHDDQRGRIAVWILLGIILLIFRIARSAASGNNINRRAGGSGWWIGPMIGGGWGGGFGGFGGGASGGGGAGGSW